MKSLSLIKPLSYKSRIKSNVSIFDIEHPVAVQLNLNLFEVCGGNGVVSLVPHGRSNRSSSPP